MSVLKLKAKLLMKEAANHVEIAKLSFKGMGAYSGETRDAFWNEHEEALKNANKCHQEAREIISKLESLEKTSTP